MAKIFYDRIKETTTTTGTGSLTLAGAVAQFVAFSARYAVNEPFYYCEVGQTGTEWEVGKGHLSSGTVLVKDRVFESSNADALVNFSAGTKDVFVTIPAERMDEIWTSGQQLAMINGQQFF